MSNQNRRLEMKGHATALDIYAQKGDLAGIRRTAQLMTRLFEDQEREFSALETAKEKLLARVNKLRHTNDLTVGYYRSSLDAFERFRTGISILQSMQSFEVLDATLKRIRDLLHLEAVGLVLVDEDFAEFVPENIATRPLHEIIRTLKTLCRTPEKGRDSYLGNTREALESGCYLGCFENDLHTQSGQGTCFIKGLRNKYQPERPVGLLTFFDKGSERYTRDKATDFLEHFCDILGWSVVTMREHEKLERDRVIDPLTGLHNRAYLDKHAPRLLELADRKGFPVSCMFLDLNGFKTINDTLGHDAGDQVLMEVAARLKTTVRAYDICVRLGGDEFLVLMPDVGAEDACSLSDRIKRTLQQLPVAECTGEVSDLQVSTSSGIAERKPGQSLVSLLQAADQAMYEDKKK